jgi:hypothetical protein
MAATTTFAQTNVRAHDLIVSLGGGISNLGLKSSVADKSSVPFGYSAGLGYIYYFAERLGINTGLEIAVFKGGGKFASYTDSYQAHDGEEYFDFNYTLNSFSETQRAVFLNIPLMLRYRHDRFYAAAGAKIGIPMSASYENRAAGLQTKGFYPASNLELTAPAFKGFGRYDNIAGNGNADFSTAFFLSLEAGVKWEINGRSSFHTGVYLDYSPADVRPSRASNRLIEYTADDNYKPNSLAASSTAKLHPISFGIKVGWSFGNARWWFGNKQPMN